MTGLAGCCAMASPTSKWKSTSSTQRMAQMAAEGVEFRTNVEVGVAVSMDALLEEFDAVALTGGAEWPRDLAVPNRALDGIHFAMDFLTQQNRRGGRRR